MDKKFSIFTYTLCFGQIEFREEFKLKKLFFALYLISISLFAQQGGVEKIIFASIRDSTSLDPSLYMMNLDGNNITRINDTIIGYYPRISHDGKRIAYLGHEVPISTLNQKVYVLDLETNQSKIVSLLKGKDGIYFPTSSDCVNQAWSPDDSLIVYTEFSHWTSTVIYKVKSDTLSGFERTLLTPHLYGEGTSDWAPSGNILYVTSFFQDSLYDFPNFFTMDSRGNNRHRLTNFTQLFKEARYSPDGKRIAFLMYQGNQFDIFTMNSDGTYLSRITNIGIIGYYDVSLSWSPDGRKIVFNTSEQIYIVDLETKEITQITNDKYKNFTPEWAVLYPTSVKDSQSKIVEAFELLQNYPNPFNPITRIEFSIKERGNVKLNIYDVLGREIITLVNSEKDAGKYKIDFDGSDLSSGIYFYNLIVSGKIKTKSMVLLR